MNVIIIGAGAAGTMAAWRLADAGHQVTLLEQFKLDHDRGSSFGESRIVRRVYPDSLYTSLMAEAYTLWDELQAKWKSGCPFGPNSDEAELINRSGGLFFGPTGNVDIASAEHALQSNRVEYEKLNANEVCERFPEFRLDPQTVALYEPTMGYARASNAVNAAAYLAVRAGTRIIDETRVMSIKSDRSEITVITEAEERYTAQRALITAGPWTNKFLTSMGINVPLQVTRQVYIHLERTGTHNGFESQSFPTWIDIGENVYGFPQIGNTEGVKIASHNRGAVTDPETVLRSVCNEDRDLLRSYAACRFDGLGDKVVYEKVCLYTNTPNEDFLIDEAPGLPGVYTISACSGHGFKFAPLLGQIGADLVLGNAHQRDLSRFRLSRLH